MYSNMRIDSKVLKIGRMIFAASVFFTNIHCSNQLEVFADKGDDDALFYAAQVHIDKEQYALAIADCADMSPEYLAGAEALELCAMAYAGRCGFTLQGTVSNLNSAVAAAPVGVLQYYAETVFLADPVSDALKISDCNTAENYLRNIGVAAVRTDGQNLLMTMVSLRKIALIVNKLGDNVLPFNSLDGAFACGISDADANLIGSAFWEANKSLTEIGIALTSLYHPIYLIVDGMCDALKNDVAPSLDLCGAVDPEVLDANQRNGARTLIKESAVFGVGECPADSPPLDTTCECP